MQRVSFKFIHKEAIMLINGIKVAMCSYVPGLSDHRGVSLYIYAKQNGLELEDFDLVEEKTLLTKLFRYMEDPIHIRRAITSRFKKVK